MNMNQFTQKSLAAIQGAQDIALEYGHQQIEQAHLLVGSEMCIRDRSMWLRTWTVP